MLGRVNPKLITRQLGDLTLIYNFEDKEICYLNPVSNLIWTLINQGFDIENIVAEIVNRYPEISVERIKNDVLDAIQNFKSVKMLLPDCSEDNPISRPQINEQEVNEMTQFVKNNLADGRFLRKAGLVLTYRCNFSCKHCYVPDNWRGKDELTLEEWKRVILDLKDLGCMEVIITGGEPFIRSDLIEILKFLDHEEFSVEINTNGYLLNFEILEQLKSQKFLRGVNISVYGLSNSTMQTITKRQVNVNNLINNIKQLQSNKIHTYLKYIPMKDSWEDLLNLEQFKKETGIEPEVILTPIFPKLDLDRSICEESLTREQINIMLQKNLASFITDENLIICNNHGRCSISPSGNVSTCEWMAAIPYGNVRTQSIKQIWYSDELDKIFKEFELNSQCSSCKIRKYCERCNAYGYLDSQNWNGVSHLCCELAKSKAEFMGEEQVG